MFKTNILPISFCAAIVVITTQSTALANEIVSEYGSVKSENGELQYFAPTDSKTPESMLLFIAPSPSMSLHCLRCLR